MTATSVRDTMNKDLRGVARRACVDMLRQGRARHWRLAWTAFWIAFTFLVMSLFPRRFDANPRLTRQMIVEAHQALDAGEDLWDAGAAK